MIARYYPKSKGAKHSSRELCVAIGAVYPSLSPSVRSMLVGVRGDFGVGDGERVLGKALYD